MKFIAKIQHNLTLLSAIVFVVAITVWPQHSLVAGSQSLMSGSAQSVGSQLIYRSSAVSQSTMRFEMADRQINSNLLLVSRQGPINIGRSQLLHRKCCCCTSISCGMMEASYCPTKCKSVHKCKATRNPKQY